MTQGMKNILGISSLRLHSRLAFALLMFLSSVPLALGSEKGSGLDALKIQVGDAQGNEKKSLKSELLIVKSEKKALIQINKLIRKYKKTPLEPDLLFRKGELYMRRAKSARFFEFNRTSPTLVSLAPKVVKKASSKRNILRAVATYEEIQRRYPTYRQIDRVVFNNAFARQSLGQIKTAEKLYFHLVKHFRRSALVPDAHLAIGEINFDRKNFKLALQHFDAIKQYPQSRVFPYGLYKAAWSHYNLRNARAGLAQLEQVVEFGKYVAKNGIDARLDLRKEALIDMTLFYEDVKPAKEAFRYFKAQAGELEVGPVILKLAKLYERHSRFKDLQVVLNDFLGNLPLSPQVPDTIDTLIWSYYSQKDTNGAIASLDRLIRKCARKSQWAQANQKNPVSQAEAEVPGLQVAGIKNETPLLKCDAIARGTSLKLAGRWLKAWKKLNKDASYGNAAEKAFEIYLSLGNKGKEAGEAQYAYAELLFQRQKFLKASQMYSLLDHKAVEKSLSHDADYAAIVSFEKAHKKKKLNLEQETQLKGLIGSYLDRQEKGQYRLDVRFKLAMIAYEAGRYAEAAPILLDLGKKYAKLDKGQKAQDLYMDILNINKDYAQLKIYAGQLLKTTRNKKRAAKLKELYEQSYFLNAQKVEEKGDLQSASSLFARFAQTHPSSLLAEKALWNVMNLEFKMKRPHSGATKALEYYEKYPQSKDGVSALLKAAQTFEDMNDLLMAASVVDRLVIADAKNASKWREISGEFNYLSGRYGRARSLYRQSLKSTDLKIRAQSAQRLMDIENLDGSVSSQRRLASEFAKSAIEPWHSDEKVAKVQAIFDSGDLSKAFLAAKKIVGSKLTKSAKAKARFIQAQILEDEFQRQSVKSSVERVALVLAIKTEKLDKAQRAYQSAISYGDPEISIRASERLSGCYQSYVKALKEMPTPRGLSPNEDQLFRNELSNLIVPLEEKGVESLMSAYQAAERAGLRDGSLGRIQASIDRLNLKKTRKPSSVKKSLAVLLPRLSKGVSR